MICVGAVISALGDVQCIDGDILSILGDAIWRCHELCGVSY